MRRSRATKPAIIPLSPSLAHEIGLHESVIFLAIEKWIIGDTKVFDTEYLYGQKWVKISAASVYTSLSLWSREKIKSALNRLSDRRLITVVPCRDAEKNNWVAINYREVEYLRCVKSGKEEPEDKKGVRILERT